MAGATCHNNQNKLCQESCLGVIAINEGLTAHELFGHTKFMRQYSPHLPSSRTERQRTIGIQYRYKQGEKTKHYKREGHVRYLNQAIHPKKPD